MCLSLCVYKNMGVCETWDTCVGQRTIEGNKFFLPQDSF